MSEALFSNGKAIALYKKSENAFRKGDFRKAGLLLERIRPLVATNKERANLWLEISAVQHAMLRPNEAVDSCRKALKLAPENPTAHLRLVINLERANHTAEAVQAGEAALDRFGALPELAYITGKAQVREGDLQRARDLFEGIRRSEQRDELRRLIAFDMARLYDKLGLADKAFACFREGNAIAGKDFDPATNGYQKDVNYLTDYYSNHVPEENRKGDTRAGANLVFLLGFPRSGTTLLDQVLDAHPDVVVLEEEDTISAVRDQLVRVHGNFAASLPGLEEKQLQALRDIYWSRIRKLAPELGGRILVDKMPMNTPYVGFMHYLFPAARFILALRHPADCCLSSYMQDFLLNDGMLNFVDLANTTRLYAKMFSLWNVYSRNLDLSYVTIRYEDVVADLSGEVERLCRFLGVSPVEGMYEFHRHARQRESLKTPSYQQVTQPVYRTATGRWQKYQHLMTEALKPLAPFVEQFGYADEPEAGRESN